MGGPRQKVPLRPTCVINYGVRSDISGASATMGRFGNQIQATSIFIPAPFCNMNGNSQHP